MIWSKHDFEREVRRQLVELASIRKRVPQDPDVLARIGKLEESHKHLLKKLAEILPRGRHKGARDKKSRRPAPPPGASPLLSKYLRTVERSAGAVERLLTGLKDAVASSGAPSQRELPTVGVKCAACGKVLFSGLLGGEEVVSAGARWYHKGCTRRGDGFSKRTLLN
jgi:hypothetical protein